MKSFIVLLASFLTVVPLSAHAQIYSVANGQTVQINAHGTCYNVTNNGGPTTMVPTGTPTEWSYFINRRPGHISLSGCCTTEGPHFSQWTYYWNYSTDLNQRNFSWAGTQYYPVQGTKYETGGWTYFRGTLQVSPYYYSVYRVPTSCAPPPVELYSQSSPKTYWRWYPDDYGHPYEANWYLELYWQGELIAVQSGSRFSPPTSHGAYSRGSLRQAGSYGDGYWSVIY